jgi:hypothetical protein
MIAISFSPQGSCTGIFLSELVDELVYKLVAVGDGVFLGSP